MASFTRGGREVGARAIDSGGALKVSSPPLPVRTMYGVVGAHVDDELRLCVWACGGHARRQGWDVYLCLGIEAPTTVG
jgi:hypothetical protein